MWLPSSFTRRWGELPDSLTRSIPHGDAFADHQRQILRLQADSRLLRRRRRRFRHAETSATGQATQDRATQRREHQSRPFGGLVRSGAEKSVCGFLESSNGLLGVKSTGDTRLSSTTHLAKKIIPLPQPDQEGPGCISPHQRCPTWGSEALCLSYHTPIRHPLALNILNTDRIIAMHNLLAHRQALYAQS